MLRLSRSHEARKASRRLVYYEYMPGFVVLGGMAAVAATADNLKIDPRHKPLSGFGFKAASVYVS